MSSLTLKKIKEILGPAFDEFGVKRLDVFGSLARGNETADSDVDLLVEFEDPDLQPSRRYFGLLHYIEDKLEMDVDLITINSLKNPYFRDRVLQEKVTIYER